MNPRLLNLYDFAKDIPCLVCGDRAELHHIQGGVSFKTWTALPRRSSHAEALFVPLCAKHHRSGGDSVHALGEAEFERTHGMPEGHLVRVSASILARFILGPAQ